MDDLSMIQKRVLVFIKSFMNNYGYPPTVREIAAGTDIGSTSTVHSSLNALESKGYIYRDGGQSRSIVLAGAKNENGIYSVPLLEQGSSKISFVDIPRNLVVEREGVFAVKCANEIEEKHVLCGDILVSKSCNGSVGVKDGDIVVYEDHSIGVYYEEKTTYGEYRDTLAELYALDAFEETEFDMGNQGKKIIGKGLVCIRYL